jgi:hypothetical protein
VNIMYSFLETGTVVSTRSMADQLHSAASTLRGEMVEDGARTRLKFGVKAQLVTQLQATISNIFFH